MSLFVVHHLNAMFNGPQEAIGILQLYRSLLRNPLGGCQGIQHLYGLFTPQINVTPTGNELLSLNKEFDLSNTAAPELQIVAKNGNFTMTFHRMYLSFERLHIRNGSKDSMNAVALEVNNPKSQSDLCDLLFLASFHFNVGKIDETVLELLEVQEKLRALQTAGLNKAESWLLETAKKQLTSKVDEILAMVNRQRSKQIN